MTGRTNDTYFIWLSPDDKSQEIQPMHFFSSFSAIMAYFPVVPFESKRNKNHLNHIV